MEICKAPNLRLKALNKQSITHIMYIDMENSISHKNVYKKEKKRTRTRKLYFTRIVV